MQRLFPADIFLQVYGMTPDRTISVLIGLIAIASVVFGWVALARSARRAATVRRLANTAIVAGTTAMALSTWHLLTSTGAIGTGSGKAGAIVALVLGLIGTTVGAFALMRMRRMARNT